MSNKIPFHKYLPVLDQLAEDEILETIRPRKELSGQKRPRGKEVKLCTAFQKGYCRFGTKCRFSHEKDGTADEINVGRDALRNMASERMQNMGITSEGARSNLDVSTTTQLTEAVPNLAASTVTSLSRVDRYFTRYYAPDVSNIRGEDMYIYLQSNRIVLVGLAPTHPILRYRMDVTNVQFATGLQQMQISGKKKHGQIALDANQPLCTVTAEYFPASSKAKEKKEIVTFSVRCPIRGAAIEINKRLESEPWLLSTPFEAATSGFLLALELKLQNVVPTTKALLSEASYNRLCQIRGISVSDVQVSEEWLTSISEKYLAEMNSVERDVIEGTSTVPIAPTA